MARGRTPYERRVWALLLNEDYGPALARLNKRDTAYILGLVQQNRGREARAEILRLDAKRRDEETRKRKKRRDIRIQTHIMRELDDASKPFSPQMVAFSVSLMTRAEGDATLNMDADEIAEHAGDDGNIQLYTPENVRHNVWWYH